MEENRFREILALGHEIQGIEFKGPGSRKHKGFLAKVIRASLGMANRRYGGQIILGVDEDSNHSPVPTGMTAAQLSAWTYDDYSASVSEYADPDIVFDLQQFDFEGNHFVLIKVDEFADIPILCKKTYKDVLRAGACYVRSRRKPETTEIPTQADMRDLIVLATEKRLREFARHLEIVGITTSPTTTPSADQYFNDQIESFLGNDK